MCGERVCCFDFIHNIELAENPGFYPAVLGTYNSRTHDKGSVKSGPELWTSFLTNGPGR